jgi:hypothetical protein
MYNADRGIEVSSNLGASTSEVHDRASILFIDSHAKTDLAGDEVWHSAELKVTYWRTVI